MHLVFASKEIYPFVNLIFRSNYLNVSILFLQTTPMRYARM